MNGGDEWMNEMMVVVSDLLVMCCWIVVVRKVEVVVMVLMNRIGDVANGIAGGGNEMYKLMVMTLTVLVMGAVKWVKEAPKWYILK